MKNIPTITASLLLVATLAGCSHFMPPEPHQRFKGYPAPEQNWMEDLPPGIDMPDNSSNDNLQPGDPGYYRE